MGKLLRLCLDNRSGRSGTLIAFLLTLMLGKYQKNIQVILFWSFKENQVRHTAYVLSSFTNAPVYLNILYEFSFNLFWVRT